MTESTPTALDGVPMFEGLFEGMFSSLRVYTVVSLTIIHSSGAWMLCNHQVRLFRGLTSQRNSRNSLILQEMTPKPHEDTLHRQISSFSGYDASIEALRDRVDKFVQQNNCRLAACVAGGGGNFLSMLASTPGASRILLEGVLAYDRESFRHYVNQHVPQKGYSYCSADAADLLAESALQRAIWLAASDRRQPLQQMPETIGLGCTSVLQTTNSNGQQTSRAFVAAKLANQTTYQLQVDIQPDHTRCRFDEDLLVAHSILSCLEYAVDRGDASSAMSEEQTANGDVLQFTLPQPTSASSKSSQEVLAGTVKRVRSGNAQTVLLVPRHDGFTPLAYTNLPQRSLIFPGSFNPPHEGHVKLARTAMDQSECNCVFFELSITNADKPALEAHDVTHRLEHFLQLSDKLPKSQWGILLTDAPLFVQKVDLLHPIKVGSSSDNLSFVIGTDTLVRLVDPRYYGNSETEMFEALRKIPCQFFVGGRLEQKKDSDEPPVFVSGEQDIAKLPSDLQDKFVVIPDFRVDISSSELRKKE